MGTKISFILLAIAMMSVSCSKVDNNLGTDLLEGVWVSSATGTDTLDFNVKPSFTNSPNTFQLKRGTKVNKGQELPKIGSGYYEYVIDGDNIILKGLVIDVHSGKQYDFKQNADNKTIQVGAFAPFEGDLPIYEFVRID